MKKLVIALALAFPFAAAHAAPPASEAFKNCSTKASKMTPKTELLKTAPVKEKVTGEPSTSHNKKQ